MCFIMTVDRNTEASVRDHHYWLGILMMLVSKLSKLFSLLTVMLVKLNLQDKQRWRDDRKEVTLSRSK